jgi:hypothetical protein
MSSGTSGHKDASRAGSVLHAIIITILTSVVALAAIFRSPELMALFLSAFTRVPQFSELYAHFDLLHLKAQTEFFQNLSGQMVKTKWSSFEFRAQPFSIRFRLRCILTIASTDISVIIPTLNEAKYLPKCLNSLTNQSRREIGEIVVVDGGSTDGTVKVARKYSDIVLVEQGQAVGASRNLGARNANGAILAFIDADTIASLDWLEEIERSFHESPPSIGVTGPTLPYGGTKLDELAYRVATGWAQRLSLKIGLPHVAGFNCAYRREAFWQAGGFDEGRELSEDVMLSLKMRHQGRIIFNPDMVAHTSLRRIKKYGYPYLTTYYAINASALLLFNRSLAYPKVR